MSPWRCTAYFDKEFGIAGYFVGVPCILDNNVVEKIMEVELEGEEKKAFEASVQHVKDLVASVKL